MARRRTTCDGVDAVVLPGGFSYGDYLRCGAISRFAPVMTEVVDARAGGGHAGARHLQRLPDPLRVPPAARRADPQRPPQVRLPRPAAARSRTPHAVDLVVRPRAPRSSSAEERRGRLRRRRARPSTGSRARAGCVARYLDDNPNGSLRDIAGITNERGNVVGLMPHPEHAVEGPAPAPARAPTGSASSPPSSPGSSPPDAAPPVRTRSTGAHLVDVLAPHALDGRGRDRRAHCAHGPRVRTGDRHQAGPWWVDRVRNRRSGACSHHARRRRRGSGGCAAGARPTPFASGTRNCWTSSGGSVELSARCSGVRRARVAVAGPREATERVDGIEERCERRPPARVSTARARGSAAAHVAARQSTPGRTRCCSPVRTAHSNWRWVAP